MRTSKYYYPLNDEEDIEIFHDSKKQEILLKLNLNGKTTELWLSAELATSLSEDVGKLAKDVWWYRETNSLEESLYGYEGIDY